MPRMAAGQAVSRRKMGAVTHLFSQGRWEYCSFISNRMKQLFQAAFW